MKKNLLCIALMFLSLETIMAQTSNQLMSPPKFLDISVVYEDPYIHRSHEASLVHYDWQTKSLIPIEPSMGTSRLNGNFVVSVEWSLRSSDVQRIFCDGVYDLITDQAGNTTIILREVYYCITNTSETFVANWAVEEPLSPEELDVVSYNLINNVNESFESAKNEDLIANLPPGSTLPEYYEVEIGNQIWMDRNLNTSTFRNGDSIQEARTWEEWKRAAEQGIPAWSYYDNNSENGQRFGKIYNWYAAHDQRGLAPAGWRIPTREDWNTLFTTLGEEYGDMIKSTHSWKACGIQGNSFIPVSFGNGNNSSGLNMYPGGRRYFEEDGFHGAGTNSWLFVNSGSHQISASAVIFENCELQSTPAGEGVKFAGYYVRTIRD